MKVALVVQGLSIHGGTQKQVLRLAQDLRLRGASVQILTFDYDSARAYQEFSQFEVNTCTSARRSGWLGRILGEILASWRLVSEIAVDTDILNIHDHGSTWVLFIARYRRPQVRIVWQINDLHPACRVGTYHDLKPKWNHPIHRYICRLAAKVASKVTVNVMKNKLKVDKFYKVESVLIYPGVDQFETHPITRRFKTPLELLSTGVFFPYRNYEVLLRAMVCLRAQGVASNLALVGATHFSEAYTESIRLLADELGVLVRITGEVDDMELRKIILQSDLFLFPNLDQSWGLAVFEAMSSSLPAVISKSAGAAELLADRPGAIAVDAASPEDVATAVIKITKTQEGYSRFCRDAFDTVSEMSWSAMYCREAWQLFSELSLQRTRFVPAPSK
jgi:glycosyltransferase involved in cell wall biosynthesis